MASASTDTNCSHTVTDPAAVLKVANFYSMVVISVAGILANLLIIVVFSRTRNKTSLDVLMMALAYYDILLVITQNLYVHRYVYPLLFSSAQNQHTASQVTIIALSADRVVHVCNTYTIVLLSLDRYVHVCQSARSKSWCTFATAKKTQVALLAASAAYNVPAIYTLMEVFVSKDYSVDNCFGYFQFPADSLGANEAYRYVYDFILYVIIVYFVPLVILCFSNANLIKAVMKRKRFSSFLRTSQLTLDSTGRGGMDSGAAGNRVIAILVIVTAVFSLCQVPVIIGQISSWPVYDGSAVIHMISSDAILINCSINCVIYTFSSRTFRKKLACLIQSKGVQPTPDQTGAFQL